jgi:hypothetical protein
MRVDQIEPVRPAGIGLFRGIAEFVEHSGKLYPKFPDASSGDKCPFFFCLRTGKNNLVLDIALHLPHVAGMCFSDVHNQEGNAPSILLVKLIKGRNLPPERGSGVAAEYQNHGLLLA